MKTELEIKQAEYIELLEQLAHQGSAIAYAITFIEETRQKRWKLQDELETLKGEK